MAAATWVTQSASQCRNSAEISGNQPGHTSAHHRKLLVPFSILFDLLSVAALIKQFLDHLAELASMFRQKADRPQVSALAAFQRP